MLKLFSLRALGDFDDFWAFHPQGGLERNHLQNHAQSKLPQLRVAA